MALINIGLNQINGTNQMIRYSISDLEKITGIKAHTIRIWEKRYKIISPERTPTNIRYYQDGDLKKLLNISTLNRHGMRISNIVTMPDTEIIQKVTEITGNAGDHESHINSLVLSMIDLNEDTFERTLSNAIFKIGFEKTVTHILYPFLEKVGVLWQIGSINPAQEHFIVSLIRQKLIVAIDAQESKPLPETKTFLLFLPEKELHELGLLFYSYLLKKNGFRVIYLGQSVPFDDLIEVLKIRNADYLLTYFVAALAPEEIPDYLNKISRSLPDKKIWISGIQTSMQSLKHPPNVLIIKNAESFKELISKIH